MKLFRIVSSEQYVRVQQTAIDYLSISALFMTIIIIIIINYTMSNIPSSSVGITVNVLALCLSKLKKNNQNNLTLNETSVSRQKQHANLTSESNSFVLQSIIHFYLVFIVVIRTVLSLFRLIKEYSFFCSSTFLSLSVAAT